MLGDPELSRDEMLAWMLAAYREQPGGEAIIHVLHSTPALRDFVGQKMDESAERWAKIMMHGQKPTSRDLALGQVISVTLDAVLSDAACRPESESKKILAALGDLLDGIVS